MLRISMVLIALFAVVSFSVFPTSAETPATGWKSGINYDVIEPRQPTRAAPPRIEVVEAFWYSCPHCNALEPDINRWLQKKPEYIQFVRIPVTWNPQRRADARLYYVLTALHRQDLHQDVFDTIHVRKQSLYGKSDAETYELQLEFAQEHGIAKKDFLAAYNSEFVEKSLEDADRLTRAYRIAGVPSMVVNGRYSTDLDKAGSTKNLFAIVDSLARSEHESLASAAR